LRKFVLKWVPPSALEALFSSVDLELRQGQHFFLGSHWAKYYLRAWHPDERLGAVVVEDYNTHDELKRGFAVLSAKKRRSKIGVSFISVGFNVASSLQMKFVTPEINGLFLKNRVPTPDEFVEIVSGTIESLSIQGLSWGEIRLDAVPANCAVALKHWATEHGLNIHDVDVKKTYLVDLAHMRDQGVKSFIDTRSSNSRAQLRKARRLVEASLGPLVLEMAQSQEQLDDWFEALKVLHRSRWRGTANGSGFDHPPFDQFHQAVAQGLFTQNIMHLWRIRAGSTDIAYLHVFSTGKQAYFNLSGINYNVASTFKPGMLAHWMVIQHYLENGFDIYDFMVGTNQYKQSLSTATEDLHFFSIRKSNLAFKLEGFLRRFKRALLSKTTVNTSS
jgi:hypothetical protein